MPAVSGPPLRVLRSEGLVLFVTAVAVFVRALDEKLWLRVRRL